MMKGKKGRFRPILKPLKVTKGLKKFKKIKAKGLDFGPEGFRLLSMRQLKYVERLKERQATWASKAPKGGWPKPDYEVRHVRWLLAYAGDENLIGTHGDMTIDSIVAGYQDSVFHELNIEYRPVSWAIHKEGDGPGLGISRFIKGYGDVWCAVGLLIDPLQSRPVAVYDEDGWTRVIVNTLGPRVHLSVRGEGQRREDWNPFVCDKTIPSYDEVVGWPCYKGLVIAPGTVSRIKAVNISETVAKAVANLTGIPYLGVVFRGA